MARSRDEMDKTFANPSRLHLVNIHKIMVTDISGDVMVSLCVSVRIGPTVILEDIVRIWNCQHSRIRGGMKEFFRNTTDVFSYCQTGKSSNDQLPALRNCNRVFRILSLQEEFFSPARLQKKAGVLASKRIFVPVQDFSGGIVTWR